MQTRQAELPPFLDSTFIPLRNRLSSLQIQLNTALLYQRYALRELSRLPVSRFAQSSYPSMLDWANGWIDRCYLDAQLLCAKHGRRLLVRYKPSTRLFDLEVGT
jgi:hypothetical protein